MREISKLNSASSCNEPFPYGKNFSVSQSRAWALFDQPRSTRRLRPVISSDCELVLRARLRELTKVRPRFGYRRLHALPVREGFVVNHKPLQRLRRDEGLRVRVKKRKPARLGQSTTPSDRISAALPNHVGAFDFQFDQTTDCRVVKYLNITDEFSRQALAIDME